MHTLFHFVATGLIHFAIFHWQMILNADYRQAINFNKCPKTEFFEKVIK
jgi:hypothetical protein